MSLIGFLLVWSLGMIDAYEYLYSTFVHPRHICYNHNDGIMRLPVKMDTNIRHLGIKVYSPSSFEIDSYTIFQKLSQLEYLEIQVDPWIFNLGKNETKDKLADELFNVATLEALVVDGGSFNSQEHSWRLPNRLMTLVLKNNKYTSFNLSCCPNLKHVDFSNNSLTLLPTFTKNVLPIETLNFENNALLEFTVNDIAKFCLAKQIKMGHYSTETYQRKCECKRLLEWTKIIQISTTLSLECDSVAAMEEDCPEYTLDEATKIRDLCMELAHPTTTLSTTAAITIATTTQPGSAASKLESKNNTTYILAVLAAIIVNYNFFVKQ